MDKPTTYSVGFSELNRLLDCVMQLKINLEDTVHTLEVAMSDVMETLHPSVAEQLRMLQESNPEVFEDFKQQVQEGEFEGGLTDHVAEVIDLDDRRRLDKDPNDVFNN